MNYAQNLQTLAQMAGDSALESDPDFLAIVPDCIASAENRIQRDLDLLATRVTDETGKLTANRKVFVLPETVGTYIVLEQLRVILPVPGGGLTGIWGPPLLPVSKDCIDWTFPSELAPSSPSVPTMWCPIDQATVSVAPPPDMDYLMSCFGTMRFAPLTPKTVGSTFISSQLRDLFLAAEMIFISAQQRNWSAKSDDPAMSKSWQGEYDTLMKSAGVEELRKKLQGPGWTSRLPSPLLGMPA
jgi:hypothetical protein